MEILSIGMTEAEYSFFMVLKKSLGATSNRFVFWTALQALKHDSRLQGKARQQLLALEKKADSEVQRELTRHELRRMTMLVNQERIIKRLAHQGFNDEKIRRIKKMFNAELKAIGLTRTKHDKAKALKIKGGQ